MKYAKLKNGVPVYARNPIKLEAPITVDGVEHSGYLSTNREDVLLELGYKPVRHTTAPAEEGYTYSAKWEETETEIVQVWTGEKLPDDPYEIIDTLTGEA